MSARLEYQARRALRAVAGRIGTPPVSIALLVLAAAYTALGLAWSHRGSGEAGARLVRSFAFDVLAAALAIDALVALLRAVPQREADAGAVRRWPTAREVGRLLVRASYLLVTGAFVASTLAHDEATMRLAVGERATGAQDELVAVQSPRPYSMGPFPVTFRVESVAGALRADGGTDGLAVRLRGPDGSERTLRPWRPLWAGFGRLLVPSRAGHALRYAISVENGRTLDTGVVKLDLLPPGRAEEFRSEAVPHRIVCSIPPQPHPPFARVPIQAAVFRSRLPVAEGRLDTGGTLRFDGLVLTVPEVLPWVEIRIVRDPGIGIAALALAMAGIGGLVLLATRRRGRVAP